MRKTTLFTATLLALTACTDSPEASLADGPVGLCIATAAINGHQTRGEQTTAFDPGQAVTVMVRRSDESTYRPYTFKAGAAPSDGLMPPESVASRPYFPGDAGSSVDVYAYYPAGAFASASTFTVSSSQLSSQSYEGYMASDLVYTTAKRSVLRTSPSTALTFCHKMARIEVVVTLDADMTLSALRLKQVKPTIALVSAEAGILADEATGTPVDIEFSEGHGVLLPPQTVDGQLLELIVSSAGKTFTLGYDVGQKTFEEGRSYAVAITVGKTRLDVPVIAVASWQTAPADDDLTADVKL